MYFLLVKVSDNCPGVLFLALVLNRIVFRILYQVWKNCVGSYSVYRLLII